MTVQVKLGTWEAWRPVLGHLLLRGPLQRDPTGDMDGADEAEEVGMTGRLLGMHGHQRCKGEEAMWHGTMMWRQKRDCGSKHSGDNLPRWR
jgi:hypothetical protein